VAQCRWLRWLVVRVGRDECGTVLPCEVNQDCAQINDCRKDFRHEIAQHHAIHCEVDIIAAAGGVHLAGDFGTTDGTQSILDEKEEILEGAVVPGVAYLGKIERVEGTNAHCGFSGGHDALARQHQSVGVFDLKQRVEEVSLSVGKYPLQYRLAIGRRGERRRAREGMGGLFCDGH